MRTRREVVREELVDVLPSWMYGPGSGGADSHARGDGGGAGGFVAYKLFASVLTPLFDITSLLFRLIACFRCSARDMPRKSAAQETEMAREAGAKLSLSVLLVQSMVFAMVLAVVYNLSVDTTGAFPPFRVGAGAHYQTTYGMGALALVLAYTLFSLYVRAYEFYGHELNSWPHRVVVRYGVVAFVVGIALTIAFAAVTGSVYVSAAALSCAVRPSRTPVQLLALGLNGTLALTLGLWVFKNWQANDYLVLVSKARRNALLPNLTVGQIRKDAGVLVCAASRAQRLTQFGTHAVCTRLNTRACRSASRFWSWVFSSVARW